LLLATVFPLAMRKAFGRSAGIVAIAINLGAISSCPVRGARMAREGFRPRF
jgi:hypothetical protein